MGKPYDTLEGVIGIENNGEHSGLTEDGEEKQIRKKTSGRLTGSLAEYGITYSQVELLSD